MSYLRLRHAGYVHNLATESCERLAIANLTVSECVFRLMCSKERNRNNDVETTVIKQFPSEDHVTSLYIVMNPIMKFYAAVLAYIRSTVEVEGAINTIIKLAKATSPSWSATEESITFLERCCNRNSLVKDDDEWSTAMNDFIKAAFRDLSVLKNPAAMEVFRKLANAVLPTCANGEDMFIWARTIKERPDGSAVVILHVSDVKRFRSMIENHDFVDNSTDFPTLEEVVQIGS